MKRVWSMALHVAAVTFGVMTIAQASAPMQLCLTEANDAAQFGCKDTGCEKDGGICARPEPTQSASSYALDDCFCLYE